jgi:hypothetical protein
MSARQESLSDVQDASRFAPKWARDPDQSRSARPPRPDGVIWLGDAEEAAQDGFMRRGEEVVDLFPPRLEPTVMPDTWSTPRAGWHTRLFLGLAAVGLAAATLAVGVVSRSVGTAVGDIPTRAAPPRPAPAASSHEGRLRALTGRLVVSSPTSAFLPDQVAPLGVAIYGTSQGGDVVMGGYAPGSKFSAGQAVGQGTWLLSASQIDGAVMAPPSGFAGVMDMVFDLRLADGRVVDRKRARLEWSASPPAASPNLRSDRPPVVAAPSVASTTPSNANASSGARSLTPAELGALLKRGNELVSHGDLIGARLVFERAAQTGEPRAALALASTYDPVVLEQLGERGLAPDVAMARFWYEKAKSLGSKEAPERLEVLASRAN